MVDNANEHGTTTEDEEHMITNERERILHSTTQITSHHMNTNPKTEREDTLPFWSIIPRQWHCIAFSTAFCKRVRFWTLHPSHGQGGLCIITGVAFWENNWV